MTLLIKLVPVVNLGNCLIICSGFLYNVLKVPNYLNILYRNLLIVKYEISLIKENSNFVLDILLNLLE